MIAGKEQDIYFKHFAELERRRATKDPSWLQKIRKGALDRFADLGFPTTRVEEWKYTSVAPITRVPFRPAAEYLAPVRARQPNESVLAESPDRITVLFFNSQLMKIDAPRASLPTGLKVGSLAEALATRPELIEAHVAKHAAYEKQPFVALNTAFWEEGAFVEIAPNVALDLPIFLIFATGRSLEPLVHHPRNLILMGRGSQATIVEQYRTNIRGTPPVYFMNAVSEVVLEEDAKVEYIKEQQDSREAFHIATLRFQQERSSGAKLYSFAFGSSLAREDAITVLDGEGAEATLNGLFITSGRQHMDNHTTIDHAKPHCSSRELYKGVLDGKSTGVFNGKIIVRKDAQKTDSKQSNKNLLLAEDCVMNTKPELEIFADDVKCTHGATIGQIDAEAVFYLRSRGIGLEEARSMLTVAFANDVIGKLKFEPLREWLQQAVVRKLAKKQESGVENREPEELSERVSRLHEAR